MPWEVFGHVAAAVDVHFLRSSPDRGSDFYAFVQVVLLAKILRDPRARLALLGDGVSQSIVNRLVDGREDDRDHFVVYALGVGPDFAHRLHRPLLRRHVLASRTPGSGLWNGQTNRSCWRQ